MREAAVRFLRRALHALRRRIAPPPIIRLARDEQARVLDNQLLHGRNALITGAGRNIGRAAVYLASEYFSQFTTGSTVTVDAGLLTRPQHE